MYVHHRSKEELLYAISLVGHQRLLAALHEASAQGVTPTERLENVALTFGAWHAARSVQARVVNYELRALTPEHYAEVAELRHGIDTVFRSIVAAGVATGEFDVKDVAMTCVALASLGVDISRWYRSGGGWSTDDVAAHYRDNVMRMVAARATASTGARTRTRRSRRVGSERPPTRERSRTSTSSGGAPDDMAHGRPGQRPDPDPSVPLLRRKGATFDGPPPPTDIIGHRAGVNGAAGRLRGWLQRADLSRCARPRAGWPHDRARNLAEPEWSPSPRG